MTFWTPESLRTAAAGAWLVRPPQIQLPKDRPADLPLPPMHMPITGLSTDSRAIKPGQVFLALRGERFDGHAFLADAVAAGSPVLIVEDEAVVPKDGFEPAVGVMKVADTGKALLKIAAAYRKSLNKTKVVAVCGSNGKTTTTNLIGHILNSCGLRGSTSKKSFNNSIGVPLTILAAQPSDQYLVCEVGTNAPGEIAQLAEVVCPDIAVIVSIGREHLERLGDLAGVAREEAAVLKHVTPGGCAVINADCPELAEHLKKAPPQILFGRSPQAQFRLGAVRHLVQADGRVGLEMTINDRQTARLGLMGEHNAVNALAALAVARRLGIDESRAIAALATAAGPEMRLQMSLIATSAGLEIRILNDAYNANPDSMIAAIRTLGALGSQLVPAPTRVVAVLGDMLEMGDSLVDGHQAVGEAVRELHAQNSKPDLVVFAGPSMKHAHQVLMDAGWAPSSAVHLPEMSDIAAARIAAMLRPGDLVLLKGSRRMRLERVVEAIGCTDGGDPSAAPAFPGTVAIGGRSEACLQG